MPDNILRYKYLPINEDSLKTISEGTIKFSSPSEFNDPFDCSPDYDVQKNLQYVTKRKDLLKIAGERLGLSPAKRIQNKKKMLKNVERATSQDGYGGKVAEQTGICCLSRDPLNLLMWAHYAKNHTGFVIEFSIPQKMEDNGEDVSKIIIDHLFPLEVEYSRDKPVIDTNDDNDTNLKKQFLTKSLDWSYEQEERVIDYIRGSGIHPYRHTTILMSVIAGLKMTDSDFQNLKSVIAEFNDKYETDVKLYKAKKIKGEFAIHVPERPELSNTQKTLKK